MTTLLIHPIEAATPTQTWLKAAKYLAQQKERMLFNLILGVHEPTVVAAEDFRVHDIGECLPERSRQAAVGHHRWNDLSRQPLSSGRSKGSVHRVSGFV